MHLLYDLYYALMPIPISPMLALFVVLTKSVSGHIEGFSRSLALNTQDRKSVV